MLLGGESDHTIKRVVEFCDGWFPRPRNAWEPKSAMERLKKAAAQAGRDPKTLAVSVFAAPADKEKLAPYREAGIDRSYWRCRISAAMRFFAYSTRMQL